VRYKDLKHNLEKGTTTARLTRISREKKVVETLLKQAVWEATL
jgi:hypothetical protein